MIPFETWLALASLVILVFGGILGWAMRSARKDADVDHLQARVESLSESSAKAADAASRAAAQVIEVNGRMKGVFQRLEHIREDVHTALSNIGQRDIEVRRKVNRIREKQHDIDKRVHVLERLRFGNGGRGGIPEHVESDQSTPLDI